MKEAQVEKLDKSDYHVLASDKVTKQELASLLPDPEMQDQKIRNIVEEHVDELQAFVKSELAKAEQKVMAIKNEFDIDALHKLIDTKANTLSVANDFNNHEFKISTLDANLIAIAQDFETFQAAINRMHSVMIELQEANKDVLLGKRNVNCLSCGITDASAPNVVGKDGRVYRASLSKGFQDMTLDFSSEYKNMNKTSPGPGPARISSANPHKRSAARFSDIMNNNAGVTDGAPFNRAQSLSGNQYGNHPQRPYGVSAEVRSKHYAQAGARNQKSLHSQNESNSNASAAHLSQNLSSANMGQNSLTAGASYQNVGHHNRNKNKLPIGFLVQQEKRELHKMGVSVGGKMRPDSAKVTLGNRSRALLAHEL